MEEFRAFRDTNYSVSNKGVVMNHTRGNIMKQGDLSGYKRVSLSIDKKNKAFLVHRMVAECFLTDWDESLVVNHKDGIKHHNFIENLEMMTVSENQQHSRNTLKNVSGGGRRSVIKISLDGEVLKEYKSISEAARDNGVHRSSISRALNGVYGVSAGFKWEYK